MLTLVNGRKKKPRTSRLVFGKEAQIQSEFVALIKEGHPDIAKSMLSVPNEGARSFSMLAYLKKLGLLKGASDLIILYPTEIYPSMLLEFKSPRGVLTKEQEAFLRHHHNLGLYTCVPRSTIEALEHFYAYLNNEPRNQNY